MDFAVRFLVFFFRHGRMTLLKLFSSNQGH
jgi:hypothetical protein